MMIPCVAVLFLALATSDVNGQATHEYDIKNCSMYHVAEGTHHAQNPNDPRTFYNCDGNNGGKLTNCGEGTLYDAESGVCVQGGDSQLWYNQLNCGSNPSRVGRFIGLCCDTYFEYHCATRSSTFHNCSVGERFAPDSNHPLGGACVSDPQRACKPCDRFPAAVSDPCKDTHMEYVSPCEFKFKGFDQVVRCAEGTAMSRGLCRCVRDENYICATKPIAPGCQSKRTFNFATRMFQSGPSGNVNVPSMQYTFPTRTAVPLYYLNQQDFGFEPFSLKLRLSVNQQTPQQVSVLTADPGCQRFKLEVMMNGNSVRVIASNKGKSIILQGNVGFGNEVAIRVVFDLKGRVFQATANGSQLASLSGNVAARLESFDNDGLDLGCLPIVGAFEGRMSEVSYWRKCVNINQLN
ncbi:uncharacterized protein LOC143286447 [Babylonia areolata]|uniref:uncharacterized protein LOC143286447 n=1 Tax=Babylonia areolata TaxID=304850 RepID=UPI003FD51C85